MALDADGQLRLSVGDSRNGVRIERGRGSTLVRANDRAPLPAQARVHLGHSQLLLRLPRDPLAAELPLMRGLASGPIWLVPVLAVAALLWLLAARWIGSDADTKWNEYFAPVLGGGAVLCAWCLVWGLASKIFTGRFTLTPHLRLALVFGLIMAEIALSALAISPLLTVLLWRDWARAKAPSGGLQASMFALTMSIFAVAATWVLWLERPWYQLAALAALALLPLAAWWRRRTPSAVATSPR